MNSNFSVGRLLMVGISSLTMTELEQQQLLELQPAGIILFRRNISTPAQVRALTDSLRALLGDDLIIGVDQEGGVVRRLTDGFTHITGAMALAASGDINNTQRMAEICALELNAVGINMNFAPVADVNNNPDNPVIHVRAYSDKPDTVARFAQASADGLNQNGVIPVAKHFPGHGDTAVDTHVGLAVVPHDLKRLNEIELYPFRELIKGSIPAIMIAHVHFKSIDADPLPASLSKGVVTELLRKSMAYTGLVLSDCLNMGAIEKWGSLSDAISASLMAGIDMPLVSQNLSSTVNAIRELDTRRWTEEQLTILNQAQNNIRLAIGLLPHIPKWDDTKNVIRNDEHLTAAKQIQLDSITQLTKTAAPIQSIKDLNWVCIYEPEKRSDAEDKDSYCAWFAMQCVEAGVTVVRRLDELSAEQKQRSGLALVISPRFDSLQLPSLQSQVVHAVTRLPVNADVSTAVYKYAIFEESEAAQQALSEVLFNQYPANGQLPIEQS